MKRLSNKGFTIIELMISTLVFAVVLLVLTAGIISIGKAFYKGLISSKTQEATRSLADEIGQAIQFSSVGAQIGTIKTDGAGRSNKLCAGSLQYDFILGVQLSSSKKNKLIASQPDSCSTAPAEVKTATQIENAGFLATLEKPREALGDKMRLAKMDLTSNGDTYTITIKVAYGDNDLLISPSGNPLGHAAPDVRCKGGAGSEFCAVSEISTTMQKRL